MNPPVGAAEPRVTRPLAVLPPTIESGLKLSSLSFGARIVSVPEADFEPRVPVIFAAVLVDTGKVVIVNEAEVAPSSTLTEAGTVAAVLDDSRETVAPPDPAFLERMTLPVEDSPPLTEEGETVTRSTV